MNEDMLEGGRSGGAVALLVCLMFLIAALPLSSAAGAPDKVTLDPTQIPKYVNQLDGPLPVFTPTAMYDPATGLMTDYYSILATEMYQQILPTQDTFGRPTGFAPTAVWGYGGLAHDPVTGQDLGFVRSAPSPSIEAVRGTPANVAWINDIYTPYIYAADPDIDVGSNTSDTALYPVTTTVHLHGGENSALYDGHPYSWYTWNGLHGSEYNSYARTVPNAAVYHYGNEQSPGTLWFHDRAIGLTRSNCYSGLSGLYVLRDPFDPIAAALPAAQYDMPLIIQDRNFYTDGSLKLPTENLQPADAEPAWVMELFGDVMVVNGKAWPNLNVDRGMYLFRVLDASDARWYDLTMSNGMTFTAVARNGAYLEAPVETDRFLMAPGERLDVLLDFSGYAPGTKIVLKNSAPAPYPVGEEADREMSGVIMQFTVGQEFGAQPAVLPSGAGRYAAADDMPISAERNFTLFDFKGEFGDSMASLDGQLFRSAISETPAAGTTELWRIIDSTENSHLIQVGLAHLQVVQRQRFSESQYDRDWREINGYRLPFRAPTVNLDLEDYLIGYASDPSAMDGGWQDCVQVSPGEVLTILVRFAPIDGRDAYSFDPSIGPTYIWYSHILDHEENEMMRQIRLGW